TAAGATNHRSPVPLSFKPQSLPLAPIEVTTEQPGIPCAARSISCVAGSTAETKNCPLPFRKSKVRLFSSVGASASSSPNAIWLTNSDVAARLQLCNSPTRKRASPINPPESMPQRTPIPLFSRGPKLSQNQHNLSTIPAL